MFTIYSLSLFFLITDERKSVLLGCIFSEEKSLFDIQTLVQAFRTYIQQFNLLQNSY